MEEKENNVRVQGLITKALRRADIKVVPSKEDIYQLSEINSPSFQVHTVRGVTTVLTVYGAVELGYIVSVVANPKDPMVGNWSVASGQLYAIPHQDRYEPEPPFHTDFTFYGEMVATQEIGWSGVLVNCIVQFVRICELAAAGNLEWPHIMQLNREEPPYGTAS